MKVITYSQVPQQSTYIHLAYLSASEIRPNSPLGGGVLIGMVLLVVCLAGSALKLNVKYRRQWRWFMVGAIATILILLLILLNSASLSESHTLLRSDAIR